jgi:general secretion pathway protein D
LKQPDSSLIAAYRRRAFCTTAALALVTAVSCAAHPAAAQDTTAPASQANAAPGKTQDSAPDQKAAQDKSKQDKSSQAKQGEKGKSDSGTLRVVPMPRRNRQQPDSRAAQGGPQGVRPGGPPITILPGNNPAPGGGAAPGAGTPFSFDFRGADIMNVLKFYAQMSGLTITTDQALSGPVTIINPKPIHLDEAFKILQSVLAVRGFNALQNGDVLSILPLDRAVGSTTIVNPDDKTDGIDKRNQVMTQVIPLDNVDADSLAKDLLPLVNKGASLIGSTGSNTLILTDTASNVQRFIELVNALDKASSNSVMKVYPLQHAESGSVADLINNLYKQITTRGRGAPPNPNQPQPPPQPGQPQPGAAGRPAVVAVADTRTNSVIVVASEDTQEQISKTIITALENDDEDTMLTTTLRKIHYADSSQVANLVNTVLSNAHGGAASQQSGGSPFAGRAFGFGGFFGGFGGGNQQNQQTVTSTDPLGKVVADPRTNTVLITATKERRDTINALIDQVDVDVPVETTTFVFPLKNAQASDVAYALGQAFNTGQQSGFGNFNSFFFGGGGNNGGNSSQRQPINRRLGNQNSTSPFGRSASIRSQGAPPGPPSPPDGQDTSAGIPGVMTPNGFVPTDNGDAKNNTGNEDRTRQFFGFGRNNSIGQNNGPQFGRGRNGSYANLLQLQNNVFVTPAPGGDSLIVTTTPDNYQALKQIIEALDVVPRQVMIEAIVAEVTLDEDQKLGWTLNAKFTNLFNHTNTGQAQLNLPATGFPNTFDPTVGGGQFVLSGANYTLLLQALQTDNKVKVLATPRVFTSNNQPADIEIVTQVPYISGQLIGNFTPTISNQVQYLNIGFILNVTPRITRGGLVTIDVQQEASNLLGFDVLGTGTNAVSAPRVDDRYADTSVTIQDGETVAIGGLIQDATTLQINKIPILADIPVIGQFFRSRQNIRNRVELMLFMTPHVVSTVEEARNMTRQNGSPLFPHFPDIYNQYPNLAPPATEHPAPNVQKKPEPETTPPPKLEGVPGTPVPPSPAPAPDNK